MGDFVVCIVLFVCILVEGFSSLQILSNIVMFNILQNMFIQTGEEYTLNIFNQLGCSYIFIIINF